MNYVKALDFLGVVAKEIPCIVESGAPTASTEGAVGCFYMNLDNGELYKCIAVLENLYTWEKIEIISSFKIEATAGDNELTNISKTFDEIYVAHNEGKHIYLYVSSPSGTLSILSCIVIDADNAIFSAISSVAGKTIIHSAIIFSDNTSTYTSISVSETDPTIYVGSGDAPEGTKVQIDPEGETMEILTPDDVNEVLEEAKASGMFDGAPGSDGVGIASAVLNSDYSLTLTFTDGTSYTTPSIRGANGEDGTNGTNGADGTSVTVSKVTESTASGGTNVVTFSDGSTLNVKNGKDGEDGAKGETGPQGPAYTLTDSDRDTIASAVKASLPTLTLTGKDEDGVSHTWTVYGT